MGNLRASEFADLAANGNITLEVAIRYHLTSNHYPPVNAAFIEPAIAAIEAAEEENYEHEILMPNGLVRTAGFIIDGLHLGGFVRDFDHEEGYYSEEGEEQ